MLILSCVFFLNCIKHFIHATTTGLSAGLLLGLPAYTQICRCSNPIMHCFLTPNERRSIYYLEFIKFIVHICVCVIILKINLKIIGEVCGVLKENGPHSEWLS